MILFFKRIFPVRFWENRALAAVIFKHWIVRGKHLSSWEIVDESTDFDVVRVLSHEHWHSEEHRRYEKTETAFHRAIRSAAVVRTEMNAERKNRRKSCTAPLRAASVTSRTNFFTGSCPRLPRLPPRLPGFHVYSPCQSLPFDRQLTDLPSSAMRIPLDSLAQKARPWLPSGEGGAAMAV
jgi:hypothetical protein